LSFLASFIKVVYLFNITQLQSKLYFAQTSAALQTLSVHIEQKTKKKNYTKRV